MKISQYKTKSCPQNAYNGTNEDSLHSFIHPSIYPFIHEMLYRAVQSKAKVRTIADAQRIILRLQSFLLALVPSASDGQQLKLFKTRVTDIRYVEISIQSIVSSSSGME
jgi:hypothetical protein